jgi:UDP-GlcNAc3NAcA epimerase
MPIHPATKEKLSRLNLELQNANILFIDPVGYLEMGWLIEHSSLVMTDSGGLQKEAYFFHKNCLILRKETEWTELTALGTHLICSGNSEEIVENFFRLINKGNHVFTQALYGDGHAGEIILKTLDKHPCH